jgi:putative transposase
VPTKPLPLTGRETGIDVGLKVLLVTADGTYVENPGITAKPNKNRRRLSVACRGARRAVGVGGKRWGSAPRRIQKVKRQRHDFHHKTALALVREYDVIYLEDLRIRNLSRRPKAKPEGNGGYEHTGAARKAGLHTSINDAGWYSFRRILMCKAAWAGKRVEAIPPAFTTQDCSGCGERIWKSLSVRTHSCITRGLILMTIA